MGGGVGSAIGGIAGGVIGGTPGAFAGAAVGQAVDNAGAAIAKLASQAATVQQLQRGLAMASVDANDFAEAQKKVGEIVVAFQSQASFLATPECSDIYFKTQDGFLDNLVNFTDYKNEIRKRVIVSTLPESELTLNQVYTPSEFLQEDLSKEVKSSNYVENYLKEWLQESSRKQIALLGGYGQGKSSTALMLSYQLLFENLQISTRIPILIELRGMSPRNLTPLALLGAWASRYRIEPQALMRLLIAGRLLLIFEGFDEMALIGNMEARRKHFETLWKFCYPQNKILITGRPNFFLDDQEMKKALGIDKPKKVIVRPDYLDKAITLIKTQTDLVNNPPHYTAGGVDFIDFAEAKGLTENAYLFNVVKYVVRAGKKADVDPVQDLEKAEYYLKREIARRKRA
jgi:hypothetical protein